MSETEITMPIAVDIDGPPISFDAMLNEARAPERNEEPAEGPPADEPFDPPPAEEDPLPGPPPAKLTKKVLVDRISAYQAVLARQGATDKDATVSNLMRWKVADLKGLHGRLERRAQQPAPTARESVDHVHQAAGVPQHEQLARTATGCTLLLAQGVEGLVNSQADVLGVEMEGFQANLKENGDLLTEAYADIIAEEGADAGPFAYLGSSYARLGIVLLASASSSLRKKKEAPRSGTSWPSSEEH
jgi:hypothetical protein